MKPLLKTPISYYGGKQKMLKHILPLIPKHDVYVEPFVGGGAVLFAKKPSKVEVINDINGNLATFYRVLKNDFESLNAKIQDTLHCEYTYKQTKEIYKNSDSGNYSDVDIAWACWVQCNMSFTNSPTAGFAFNLESKPQYRVTEGKKKRLDEFRMRNVYVFNRTAIDLINRYDSENAFFYFDPPYAESNCKHYEKEKHVYYELLDLLPSIKGKWLMSSYPSEQLTELRKMHGWNYQDIEKPLSVTGKRKEKKMKTECLTWNYELIENQMQLF